MGGGRGRISRSTSGGGTEDSGWQKYHLILLRNRKCRWIDSLHGKETYRPVRPTLSFYEVGRWGPVTLWLAQVLHQFLMDPEFKLMPQAEPFHLVLEPDWLQTLKSFVTLATYLTCDSEASSSKVENTTVRLTGLWYGWNELIHGEC